MVCLVSVTTTKVCVTNVSVLSSVSMTSSVLTSLWGMMLFHRVCRCVCCLVAQSHALSAHVTPTLGAYDSQHLAMCLHLLADR